MSAHIEVCVVATGVDEDGETYRWVRHAVVLPDESIVDEEERTDDASTRAETAAMAHAPEGYTVESSEITRRGLDPADFDPQYVVEDA